MTLRRLWLERVLFGAACTALIILGVREWNHLTGTRTVLQATMPNGVEIMVKQKFTWSGDLFNTSFHYRRPGGDWVWRYYSHEDGYWGRGTVTLDPSSHVASIDRDGRSTILFNWDTLRHTQFTETQDGRPRDFTVESDL
jgi:hypothetical protein